MKPIIINPQWQGGADPITYAGAMELKELYLKTCACEVLPVAPSTVGMGIYEYAPAGKRTALIDRVLELGLGI